MAIDWEAEVGAPNVAVFGEAARYFPALGPAPFDVYGVYDEGWRENVISDSLAYTSDAAPAIGINDSQFQLAGHVPAQNDKILLTDPLSKHFGKKFIVKEPRPDSHGVTLLVLNVYAGALP